MNSNVLVFKERPKDFLPKVEVAGIYVNVNGKILWLKRAGRLENGFWGVPAGKFESGETPIEAASRELFEETGIQAKELHLRGSLYISKPEIDYVYHCFGLNLKDFPPVELSAEHTEFKWASPGESEKLKFMQGARECLEYYWLITQMSTWQILGLEKK